MWCIWGNSHARLALLVGSFVALDAAGCGGTDFASNADAICNAYQAKAKAIPKPTSIAGIPGYADRALPEARASIAKLKAIAPPSDKRTAYREYLAGVDHEVILLEGASSTVRSGDTRRAAAYADQLSRQVKQDNAKATALGLKDCAKGSIAETVVRGHT
jgi:hypothetical protein